MKRQSTYLAFYLLMIVFSFFALGYELISTDVNEFTYVVEMYYMHFLFLFSTLVFLCYFAFSLFQIVFLLIKKNKFKKRSVMSE